MSRRALKPLATYRQSTIAAMEVCPRRTRFGLQGREDLSTGFTGTSGDLGSLFHAVAAEMFRTLQGQGEQQMPTAEGLEVMYEVVARHHIVLPAEDRRSLRILALRFCDIRWETRLILAIEERMTAPIECADGVTRTLTGQPDLLIAAPPNGVVIPDLKTGWTPAKQPRQPVPPGQVLEGRQYLSDRGHAQLPTYGLLAMRTYPAAQWAKLHEINLRTGDIREATMTRDELEHVARELAAEMQLIDRGIQEGPRSKVWRPRAGAHCARQCPVSRSCPVPREQRGLGALDTPAQADAEAARFMVVDGLRGQMRDALKAKHEAGYSPRTPDGLEFRWRQDPKNPARRNFGAWPPEPAGEPDARLDEAFRVAGERAREGAAA